jgi:riboflavin kinase/FMN adenylyltransferase
MLITTDFAALDAPQAAAGRKSAVTIGNFDGCHLGHQALVRRAVELATRNGAQATAVTLTPHPDCFFRGEQAVPLLFTREQKERAFAELGLERHVLQTFDAAFARVSHEEFYQDHLRRRLGMAALTVGGNFRFGRGRGGDTAYLQERGRHDGVEVVIDPGVAYGGEPISSTRLRHVLAEAGDVQAAAAMLGRPFMLEGVIEKGDQLGRTLGVPTANLERIAQLVPRFGVYAGYIWLSPAGNARPAVIRRDPAAVRAVFGIGVRPSVAQQGQPALRVEGHLLDGVYGADALYGYRAGFYLTHWLRGEEKFPSLDELKARMQDDIQQARRLLA